jgi:uncharacterized lipoprotein YajG
MNRRAFPKQMTLLLAGGLVAGCAPRGQVTTVRPTPATASEAKPAAPTSTVIYTVAESPTKPATLASGLQPATVAAPQAGIKLTILHTNDSSGYVDPCG